MRSQGYTTRDGGGRFYDSTGTVKSQPEIVAKRPNGEIIVIEVKTGNASNTTNQNTVYPQIISGDAIPSPSLADDLGLEAGKALKDQGFPNGLPLYQVTAPGL